MATITQAFVLGAGLGIRLRPLTDDLPKPLIPIFQKPLITFALDHLIDLGIESFVINTHRLPEQFANAFANRTYRDRPVRLVHEPELLGTGGGIKNIEPHLKSAPFIADWIGAGGKIGGVVLNDGKWFNIGSRAQYLEVHRVIADDWRPCYVEKREWPIRVAKGAIVATSARLSGFFSIGTDCGVGDDAIIEDTILWPSAEIASRHHLHGCIVRASPKA